MQLLGYAQAPEASSSTPNIVTEEFQQHSEPIKSIFMWYKSMRKCYMHTLDVPFTEQWNAKFLESRWSKRGWALQELLASQYVEFFLAKGIMFGDKKSLEQEIHPLAEEHPDTISSVNSLDITLSQADELEEALGVQREMAELSLKRTNQLEQLSRVEDEPLETSGGTNDSESTVFTLIGSLQSGTRLEEAARKEFQDLFMMDEFLRRLLYTTVRFSNLGVHDLARILTNALTAFAQDLQTEIGALRGSPIYEACKFLRANASRVASSLADSFYKEADVPKEVFYSLYSQSSKAGRKQLLDKYFATKESMAIGKTQSPSNTLAHESEQTPAVADNDATHAAVSPAPSSCFSDIDNSHLPVLEALKDMFCESESYESMKDSLRHSLEQHVYDWSVIDYQWRKEMREPPPRELHNARIEEVKFSDVEISGISDRIKIWLEFHTGQPWDWWPLTAPQTPIPVGKVRLYWKCNCGELEQFDLSQKLADKIRNFTRLDLFQRQNVLLQDQDNSELKARNPELSSKQNQNENAASSQHSVPSQNNFLQPSQNSTSAKQERGGSNTDAVITVEACQGIVDQLNLSSSRTTFVLLGVSSGDALPHEQIEISPNMTADEFFKSFRHEYSKLRGWLHWWHPDRFYYCHVGKYIKWDVREIAYHFHEMPRSPAYMFQPKPPRDPYHEPIPPREWKHRFFKNCSYSATDFLSCIPKRDKRFELDTCRNAREELWGLYVMYRTSARIVFAWLFVCLLPSVLFLVLRLRDDKRDLQDAVAPFCVTITTVQVLYMFLGGRFKGQLTPR